jgi:hypothetical protein
MICNKRTSSIDPLGKPVDCKSYISVGNTQSTDARPVGFCALKEEFLCIEDTDGRFPRLSFSTVSDFLDCKWKYFLKHVKGIRTLDPATSDALKMGQLWDVCVQTMVGNLPKSAIRKTIDKYEIPEIAQAKVRAVYQAFKDLEVQLDIMCRPQDRFELSLPYDFANHTFVLTGVYDRKYDNYFVETKFSKSPDYYHNLFNIIPQVGTYFAADPAMDHCIMEVVRCPNPTKVQDLSPAELREYCYKDIMARPGWYFPGWNKSTGTFGKKFHRSEFNLEEIIERYDDVYYQIADSAFRNRFTKNYKSCYRPFPCEFIPLCLFNVMSETVYGIKKKPVFTVPLDPSTHEGQVASEVETAVHITDVKKTIPKTSKKYKQDQAAQEKTE